MKTIFRIQRNLKKRFSKISGRFWSSSELRTKKLQKFLSEKQKSNDFENSKYDFGRETDKLRPICGREVRLGPKSSQNFFWDNISKIHDFIQKG